MRVQIIAAIIATFISQGAYAYIIDGSRINRPSMLSYAKSKLQNRGTIEQSASGLAYLKVPENYIKELYQQIHIPGYEMPRLSVVSIFDEEEAKNVAVLPELGQTVQFKPIGFYTTVVDDEEFFMLAIDAPQLSQIRQKYGLPDQIEDKAFNIVIGVKKREAHNELHPSENS